MVEFVVRVNQQRTAYIPKEIVENLGYEWTLVPNARTAVIYPRQCSLDTAIKSLQIILDGLKLSLAVVAAAVPLAIEAGVVTYSYGKSKGWWK